MSPDVFTITIMLKPYARKYLISNWGDPVDLDHRMMPDLVTMIRNAIRHPDHEREKVFQMNGYAETRFIISKRDFFRAGFVMSKTDQVRINEFVQDHIKMISRNYIISEVVKGVSISEAIIDFQTKYELEDVMSYELIYKAFRRYCKSNHDDPFIKHLPALKKFMRNLSKKRHFANDDIRDEVKKNITKDEQSYTEQRCFNSVFTGRDLRG